MDILQMIGIVGGILGTLIGVIAGLITHIYRNQVRTLKSENDDIKNDFMEALSMEREARREAQDRIVVRLKEREDIERRIENELKSQIKDVFLKLDDSLKNLYGDINNMRDEILLMTGEVKSLVKVCEERHKWDGKNRRREND